MGTASSRRSSATGRGCYKSDKGAGLAAGDIRFANDPAIPVAVECTPSKGIPFVVLRFFAPRGDNIFEENMTLKFTRDADCAFFHAFVTFVVRDSTLELGCFCGECARSVSERTLVKETWQLREIKRDYSQVACAL